MTRFDAVLQRVATQLAVPQPARSRILHEMAADLEDLYAEYRARGLGESEALRRAEAALGASPEAIEQLIEVHQPAWERLLARFSERRRNRIERLLVTGLTLAGVALGLGGLAGQRILQDPSAFVWPVLVLTAVALAVAAGVFFRLFIRQDHRPQRLHTGLVPLLALAAAILLAGAFGALREMTAAAQAVAAAGSPSLALVLPWLRRAAEVLALALTGDLAVLLCWFHLRQRARSIARTEADQPVARSSH
ncbi:MAG TPA: hypothetical protein VK928_00855 [Longimicrobiales bacterium]|nr:hypothetical protein [Longimicrobiales bacterium]